MNDRRCLRTSQINLVGEAPPMWKSLGRAFSLYENAIKRHPSFCLAKGRTDAAACTVFFRLKPEHLETLGTGGPQLVAMHGSCVLERALLRKIMGSLRQCDGLIVTCSSDQAIIEALNYKPSPIIVLQPLGSVLTSESANPSCALRQVLQVPTQNRIVTFIGRLIPHKSAHVFLQLIAWLRRSMPVTGILVGDYWDDYPTGMEGTKYRKLMKVYYERERLERSVLRFTGGLADEELSLVLSGSDLVFHPSLTPDENFGFVPVEAISCGTPVVSTDYGGMKDTIAHGVTGFRAKTWISETGARADYQLMFERALCVLRNSKKQRNMTERFATERARFALDSRGLNLVDGIVKAITTYNAGKRQRCEPKSGLCQQRETRWQFGRSSSQWPLIAPSVAFYVSERSPPRAAYFRSVRKFGYQQTIRDLLIVSDSHIEFRGPITTSESRVLSTVGDRWYSVCNCTKSEAATLDSLLASGVLVGTAAHL